MSDFKDDEIVFNNNEFINFDSITRKTIMEIDDKIGSLDNAYVKKFHTAFGNSIESAIPYRVSENISDRINEELFDHSFVAYQNKLRNSLTRLFINAKNHFNRSDIDINNLFANYCDFLKSGVRNVCAGNFDDSIFEFSKGATNEIRKYLVNYREVPDNSYLDVKLDDLRRNISFNFQRTLEMYLQDYTSCIREILNHNLSSIRSMNVQEKQLANDDKKISNFKNVVAFGNFDLAKEGNKYYLVDKSSDKKYTAVINDDGNLTTKENSNIRFVLPDSGHKRIGYQDEKVIIRVAKNDILIVDSQQNKLHFVNSNDTWNLLYNDISVKDNAGISQILDILNSNAPGCYNLLSGVPSFMNLINQKKLYDEKYEKYASVFLDVTDDKKYKADNGVFINDSANKRVFR